MKGAIYIPKIVNLGGVERVSYLISRELNFKIITSYYRKDIEKHFPGIKKRIILLSNRKKEPGFLSILKDFFFFKSKDYFIIYRHPRTILFPLIKNEKKYLYFLGGIPHHWFMNLRDYKKIFKKLSFKILLDRILWRILIKFVDPSKTIANSNFTSINFKKITNNSTKYILAPPLDLKRFKKGKPKGYYLTVSRLVPYKRIDWQIDAFKGTPHKLIIIGDGPLYGEYSKKIRDLENIQIIRKIENDKHLSDIYSHCKAFIFTSFMEHFGITPLEAMSCGKPIISVKEGGPKEYILEGKNGYFISNKKDLRKIINLLEGKSLKKMTKACLKTSKRYGTKFFLNKFKRIINNEF